MLRYEAGEGPHTPVKRAVEFALALLLLAPFGPLILLAALGVRLGSPGPAFYTQTRLGRGGRKFNIYKLRTMYHEVERISGVRWSSGDDDPRVTRIGRFLRRTHIDELPQLINVLKGDMSLVGPRPERPEIITVLADVIPDYLDRLAVRPGVTGLAQIHLPPDTDVACVQRKLIHDRYYIHRRSLWLDLRLMFCTGLKMFRLPLRWTARMLGIPSSATVEQAFQVPLSKPLVGEVVDAPAGELQTA